MLVHYCISNNKYQSLHSGENDYLNHESYCKYEYGKLYFLVPNDFFLENVVHFPKVRFSLIIDYFHIYFCYKITILFSFNPYYPKRN